MKVSPQKRAKEYHGVLFSKLKVLRSYRESETLDCVTNEQTIAFQDTPTQGSVAFTYLDILLIINNMRFN